ncbi:transposase [Paenibacillus yanchengensis]|uniref:Transposase n=1 Tax=Paenibacillus yanchengensis TaxID=2035833 RepID=A0ABW4YJF6_9BACL
MLKATSIPQASRWLEEVQTVLFSCLWRGCKDCNTLHARELIHTIVSTLFNGIMEGTSNKIKLIKIRGFSYLNYDHLFIRIRLGIGR